MTTKTTPLPHFPEEVRHRLCVQMCDRETQLWSEPREITLTELVALAGELSPKQRATIANAFGVQRDARLISKADLVTDFEEAARDAVGGLQAALEALEKHRDQFPNPRDGEVIDCEFPEAPQS